MRYARFVYLLGALIFIIPGLASAEPRIALLIANRIYGGDIGSPKNPVSDGKLMAGALKKVGFAVSLVTDGHQRAMKKVLNDLSEEVHGVTNSIRLVREF
jgi:uncharacterized caspase-like protein